MTTVETAVGTAKTMVLNMGPQHPSTHGVLRILLELDGETVVKAIPDLGYLHTGIEKSCEDKTYSQAITLTDRKSTRLNSSHITISYAVFCLKKKKKNTTHTYTKHTHHNTPHHITTLHNSSPT